MATKDIFNNCDCLEQPTSAAKRAAERVAQWSEAKKADGEAFINLVEGKDRAPASESTKCQHEPFEGRCVHCDVRFLDGKPVARASTIEPSPLVKDSGEVEAKEWLDVNLALHSEEKGCYAAKYVCNRVYICHRDGRSLSLAEILAQYTASLREQLQAAQRELDDWERRHEEAVMDLSELLGSAEARAEAAESELSTLRAQLETIYKDGYKAGLEQGIFDGKLDRLCEGKRNGQ